MKNRWVVLGAGIVIQSILGGVYAWSVFLPHLIEDHGFSKGQCGLVFGLSIAVFTLAMIAGGRVLARRGPRLTAAIGAVLFGAGYLTASFSDGHVGILVLGISCLSGAGIGFGYVCPLSVGMRWFPRHKGLITGVAVAGFGGGAIILSSVASGLLNSGMDVLELFAWMGLIPGTILVLCALLLAVPDEVRAATRRPGASPRSAVASAPFLLCSAGIFVGTFSGLLIIGNLTPIATGNGLAAGVAVQGVSAFAVGNAVGRILWGYLFDRLHYRAIPLSLGAFAAGLILLSASSLPGVFLATAVVLGFGFGANFVVYASALSRYFGVDSFARLYPICFLGYGLAGITGPPLGGYLADVTGSYELPLNISIGMLAVGAVATWVGLRAFGPDDEVMEMDVVQEVAETQSAVGS